MTLAHLSSWLIIFDHCWSYLIMVKNENDQTRFSPLETINKVYHSCWQFQCDAGPPTKAKKCWEETPSPYSPPSLGSQLDRGKIRPVIAMAEVDGWKVPRIVQLTMAGVSPSGQGLPLVAGAYPWLGSTRWTITAVNVEWSTALFLPLLKEYHRHQHTERICGWT